MEWAISEWNEALSHLWIDMGTSGFWVGVTQIIWIDILLAGDNAVVIALACRKLPWGLRVWGMILGAGVAVLLRILFTLGVTSLMTLPFVKVAGGLALFYIAIKLVAPDENGRHEPNIKASKKLWQAVRIIAIADVVMSLDNVIAIAGVSQGRTALFVIGLAASIPLIIAGAGIVMALLTRFPVLVWAGGALLGWIAGQVIATDPAVQDFLAGRFGREVLVPVEMTAVSVGMLIVLLAGGVLRNKAPSRRV